jgi:hypothetical protein
VIERALWCAVIVLASLVGACDRSPPKALDVIGNAAPATRRADIGVASACDSVAHSWHATGRATVRRVDTTRATLADTMPRPGCLVVAVAPGGLPDTLQSRSLYWMYWKEHPTSRWVELSDIAGDGPDGFTRTYDRDGVRCQVDFIHDGGDDSDSTVVPKPQVSERTFCRRVITGMK